MQNSLPLLVTCSLAALALNTVASIAYQPAQRAMTLPGSNSQSITPPLMIEAGDWDAPQVSSTKSLFGGADHAAKPMPRTPVAQPAARKPAPKLDQAKATPASKTPTFAVLEANGSNVVGANFHSPTKITASNHAVPVPRATPAPIKPSDAAKELNSVTAPVSIASVSQAGTAVDIGPAVKSLGKTAERAPVLKVETQGKPTPVLQVSPTQNRVVKFVGAEGRAKPAELASIKANGSESGDLVDLTRRFLDWSLACTMRLDLNERVCAIQQKIDRAQDGNLTWKIATTPDAKPIIVFEFDDQVDPATGFMVSISGFEKRIPATEWSCKSGVCQASMMIIGPVAGWFSDSPKISFAYSRAGKPISIDASMEGFQPAMTASHNPMATTSRTGANDRVAKNEKTALAR